MLQGHGYSFYSYYFFNKGEYFIIMSLDLQQYHDQIQALRPMDDVFFEVLIQQPGVCEEMLRVLLDCPDLIVLDIHAQHSIRNLLKRVRYNEACVTTQATDPGTDFENIPTVYIFLILIYSKKEKPFTTFENLLSKLTRLLMMALLKYMLTLSLMTKVLSQNIYSF